MRFIASHKTWFFRLFIVGLVIALAFPVHMSPFVLVLLVVNLFPSPRADGERPRKVGIPVRGRWVALNSPGTRVPSHGVRSLGQAFAIDLVQARENELPVKLGWGLRQAQPSDYPSFGADVVCAKSGVVVSLESRLRDHAARSTWPGIISMMTIESICRELGGSRFVLGNHITIDHEDGSFAVYAHLKEGSLNVQLGEKLEAGTVIASVGNAGNTSEPHVHFQLMDRANPSAAAGVPFQWPDAELTTSFDERFTTRKTTNRVLEGIDDFVVDVQDNLVPGVCDECHGVDEEVAGCGLDDVFDEFPAVGFQPAPFSSGSDTAVGDGRAAPPVLTQLGFT